ncbi:hypothetical protein J2Q11_00570 [Tenacibaculum finnmarkense genomovar finnmarkense]|uniref:Uncharacterized protein n=2 Tax=Tenacibaculum finnmarkense TaxID=2781243 RepID=A0A2I2LD17_9FLAO|nr:hypothetical protein [Tenacibaculum finnmarkense]MBE7696752.1 hypothetical protein [Tenacibaculum finnmarkense genomovar ulcerans]MCD8411319.1 hypothetical protein [Tenacibaculum finnmarkense genomovar ulcerans]MCD8416718.1 hypothetical protein [Tenacibaculum finnmarkense genomovar finnmarkense]MCD8453674.1 hypothetical protein [Tenacibaculum finnmarkense genomovar ulcerans]MCG8184700.1 hypothetical protein [Tenacibaculum finnmarkense genomovar finnmarkense]
MSKPNHKERSRAQESTNAIEKLYISMRHLFSRGFYKPMGISGETLRKSLLQLRPEIYGSIAEDKTELNGLVYIIERLPEGIEECQFINLTADEGYRNSKFETIIPPKRRRNCYRIDKDQMNIEITRGRSEIYDILTHITFLFIESHKIKDRVVSDNEDGFIREWLLLEDVVLYNKTLSDQEKDVIVVHLGNILGRTYDEVYEAYNTFASEEKPNRFFHLIYWLGKLAINETANEQKRSVKFSTALIEEIGHHFYGEIWANSIKKTLLDNNLLERPIHIISANMHSVMNSIYAKSALPQEFKKHKGFELFEVLSNSNSQPLQKAVKNHASKNGLIYLKDTSGTNINVQIIDTEKIDFKTTSFKKVNSADQKPVIIVMDYAFGEQAFETMDELLKPYKTAEKTVHLNVDSVSIMGKAGILEGGKGDIMIPSAHIFEGTADNYPFENELTKDDLEGFGVNVFEGTMVSVLGTSLQNKDLLEFFHDSTWNVIGLEMEGAHYQKAIQSASKIRGNIREDVKVRYAYYASDNPLETGATLASGGLGMSGVTPTYAITQKILEQIF